MCRVFMPSAGVWLMQDFLIWQSFVSASCLVCVQRELLVWSSFPSFPLWMFIILFACVSEGGGSTTERPLTGCRHNTPRGGCSLWSVPLRKQWDFFLNFLSPSFPFLFHRLLLLMSPRLQSYLTAFKIQPRHDSFLYSLNKLFGQSRERFFKIWLNCQPFSWSLSSFKLKPLNVVLCCQYASLSRLLWLISKTLPWALLFFNSVLFFCLSRWRHKWASRVELQPSSSSSKLTSWTGSQHQASWFSCCRSRYGFCKRRVTRSRWEDSPERQVSRCFQKEIALRLFSAIVAFTTWGL